MAIPLPLLLLLLLSSPALIVGSDVYGFQCPYLGINNCTANDGLAFSDGCKVVPCIGWHSAIVDPTYCRPASGPNELARCRKLSDRLERLQDGFSSTGSSLVNCPEFEGVDLCATADEYFGYHDGCNYHLCDGNGGTLERETNTCPNAATSSQLFYCSSNFKAEVRKHTSRHACSAMVNNAERICELMWPGYRFGDTCFDGNDFVCGSRGRLLIRPPVSMCPLLDASKSIKCREVASEVDDLLSEKRGYSCPDLQLAAVCTEENRGFIYYDGCNQVLCDGESSGLNEGRICKLPMDEGNTAGQEYCADLTSSLVQRVAASKRWMTPCVTPEEACSSSDAFGESYFNGCSFCTCLARGRAQCRKQPCVGFYGTSEEFGAYCARAAYRLE